MSKMFTIIVFIIFGPLIGSLLVGFLYSFSVIASGDFKATELLMPLTIIPFGYLFGIVPAAMTGAILSYFETKKSKQKLISIAFYSGVSSCLIFSLVIGILFGHRNPNSLLFSLLFGLVLNVVGGLSAVIITKIKFKNFNTQNQSSKTT